MLKEKESIVTPYEIASRLDARALVMEIEQLLVESFILRRRACAGGPKLTSWFTPAADAAENSGLRSDRHQSPPCRYRPLGTHRLQATERCK